MDAGFFRLLPVEVKVRRAVDKALVNGVNVDVVRGDVFQIDGIDQGGDPLIFRHPRDGDDVVHLCAVQGFVEPDGLFGLEEPGPRRDADGLQSGRDRETDGLVGPGRVRDQEPGLQRVQMPVDAFHRGIVGFQVDAEADPVHDSSGCSSRYFSTSSAEAICDGSRIPVTRPMR